MTTLANAYRRPFFAPDDDLFRRCLAIAAGAGVACLLALLLMPAREASWTRLEQLPPRFARLVVEAPPAPPARPARDPAAAEPRADAPAPAPAPIPARPSPRRGEPAVAPDRGEAGRSRAREQVAALAATTASLERSLESLSSALETAAPAGPARAGGRRARAMRSGRTESEIAGAGAGTATSGVAADLSGSAVASQLVAIGAIGGPVATGELAAAPGGVAAAGAAPGVHRTNASLLAVIQRYAAGIQYCYANELKRDDGLRGKLVVAITVAASGEVLEATVVSNGVGSERLAACALSQIRDWRFPAIEKGVTTFQTPFVFTPPR